MTPRWAGNGIVAIAVLVAAGCGCGSGKDKGSPPPTTASPGAAVPSPSDHQSTPPGAPKSQPTTNPDGWRSDLALLARELPRLHKDLYFSLSEADFAAGVAELDRAIPGLSDLQITLALARLVARVGDGHTGLWLLTTTGTGFRRLPLELYWFADGLYITEVDAAHGWARGRKVVGIGDAAIDRVVAEVDQLISHDNPAGLRANDPTYLVVAEILHGLGFAPSADHVSFRLADPADPTGPVSTLELEPAEDASQIEWLRWWEGLEAGALPLYRQKRNSNYWNSYDAETRTLYFAYNVCADAASGMSFAELVAGSFGFIDKNPVDRLVVDLRNNGGGNSALLAPLVTAIKAHPKINRRGGLYVIIGRSTYSSALLGALELRDQTAAVLAGEPTGGKPNHYGEVKQLALPSSHLEVAYSTKYFTRVAGDVAALVPELEVAVSAADYFANRDPVLDAVIAHSRHELAAAAP